MIIYQEQIKNNLKQYITDTPYSDVPMNGKRLKAKIIQGADIIVRINMNLFEEGFWNRDICRVIAETEDGQLMLKRLEDGHTGRVSKKHVRYPEWTKYEF